MFCFRTVFVCYRSYIEKKKTCVTIEHSFKFFFCSALQQELLIINRWVFYIEKKNIIFLTHNSTQKFENSLERIFKVKHLAHFFLSVCLFVLKISISINFKMNNLQFEIYTTFEYIMFNTFLIIIIIDLINSMSQISLIL